MLSWLQEEQELLAVAESPGEVWVVSGRCSVPSVRVPSLSQQGSVPLRILLLCCLGQLSRGQRPQSVVIFKASTIRDPMASEDC